MSGLFSSPKKPKIPEPTKRSDKEIQEEKSRARRRAAGGVGFGNTVLSQFRGVAEKQLKQTTGA